MMWMLSIDNSNQDNGLHGSGSFQKTKAFSPSYAIFKMVQLVS